MNTYIVIYLVAVVADLLTTHRALEKVPTARENHSVLKLLGIDRPNTAQLVFAGATQAAALIWLCGYFVDSYLPLMAMAGWHVYYAYRNWRFVEDRA